MTSDVLFFFDGRPGALALYESFEKQVLLQTNCARVQVKKTQISFFNRRMFACVSFAPVRKAAERPANYIVITFGLAYRKESPRIEAAVQPRPNRWTHHVLIAGPEEIDAELMEWIREAADFAMGKP